MVQNRARGLKTLGRGPPGDRETELIDYLMCCGEVLLGVFTGQVGCLAVEALPVAFLKSVFKSLALQRARQGSGGCFLGSTPCW